MKRRIVSLFSAFLLLISLSPRSLADFPGGFGQSLGEFESCFTEDAGWNEGFIHSYSWTGRDGAEHIRRSAGFQKEAFEDSISALVKMIRDSGRAPDLSEGVSMFCEQSPVFSFDEAYVSSGTVQDACFLFFTGELSLSCAASCGVMGNLQAECAWNITAVGDGGTSYGLCQWHNERWSALRSFCSSRGLDSASVEGQLRYLEYELTCTSESAVLPRLRSVPDNAAGAAEAAFIWASVFERCTPDSYSLRQSLASGFFSTYSG